MSLFRILLVFIFLYSCSSFSQTFSQQDSSTTTKSVRIYNTTRLPGDKPVIDGRLDDLCWLTAGQWAGDFTQWVPNDGAKPSQPTEIKILYDDNNIYVAIRAYDSEPEKMIRKAGRRDEFNGDVVGINFDSYHDHRTGFEFNITSAGQKIDLILTNPSNWDVNWNAVWQAKTAVEDSAWTAEYEIPLNQLRYSSDREQVWGLHVWRWIDRLMEESDWEPQTSTGPGVLYQFGELHGIKDLPQFRRVEIMPYTLGKLNTFKPEPSNPFANEGRSWWGNAGLDAKIGISSNFTADITINPDFGQVESDPSVMNLSAFETFYEEKRPFFLEGKNIFSFDLDNQSIFYTRRIGHSPSYSPDLNDNEYIDIPDNTAILSALKLSGKSADGLSVGFLQSLTANEHAEIKSPDKTQTVDVEPLTNYMIARIQQDFDESNTVVGGILTSANRFINESHLEYLNRNAYTGGIDFLHQWNDKEFYVDAKLVGSSINGSAQAITDLQNSSARFYGRSDAAHLEFDSTLTNLSGHGGRIKIGKGSKGLWRYSAELNWRSPGLDFNDIGFLQTSDIFKQSINVSYFVNQPVSIFRTYNINFNQTNLWDYGLNYSHSGVSFSMYMEFLNNWAINASFGHAIKALDMRILRGGPSMYVPAYWSNSIYFRTDPSEKIFFDLNTNISLSQNQGSRDYYIQPGFSVMPMNTLKLSMKINYSSNINDLQYIDTKSAGTDKKYILAEINQQTLGITFRIDYNITPELSIQYYGSPFASVGRFSEFKSVTNPGMKSIADQYSILNPTLDGDEYSVAGDNYSFDNPDFNFSQFRSNLVLRWEYLPGSQLYLVWSSERTRYETPGNNSINGAIKNLADIYPGNIFLVKFSYWFTI